MKIGPVDPELLNLKKRNKLTQAKYIAQLAGLPSGLSKISAKYIARRAGMLGGLNYPMLEVRPGQRGKGKDKAKGFIVSIGVA